ncbi:calmodulin-regulated spectrin-associated protein 2 isoform X2 [Coregonus clupeaformis]|uniref:calmodulin-regulated spectrin-associated protein 2 isoform X2 n=1 Tax=Coregonus clupeaformis TaxID=59861 RepID=UPI001E1C9B78|nr:calmodulin-regulated spectrin-associated protein 2 isoform X2 [Coregonus clupeaformis]
MMGEVTDAREIKNTLIVPAIKSSDHYDFSRAKLRCSLTWLVAKAFGTDSVPADLKEPFYTDQYEQEHLKPPVVSLLLSAELYSRAGSLILTSGGHHAVTQPLVGQHAVTQPLVGHNAVTQPLVGHNAVTQPLVGQDAVTKPLVGQDAVTQPLVGQDAVTQPLVGQDAVTQPLVGHDALIQALVGQDAVTQPLVGQDAVTQPLVGQDAVTQPLVGHDAVIQALAQKGLYVTDQARLVTEKDLCKRPLQMSAHLAMMDTLMMAYTVETVSVEKVVACVLQYSSHHDEDADTPYDTEDAVTSWINKVNEYLKDIIGQELRRRETQSAEPVGKPGARHRKEQQTVAQQVPWIPPVDDLLKDTSDGCALASLLHFYCPHLVRLEDICLKERMSLADSLYNLQLVQDFCQEHLNRCCHFSLEDMVYASSSLKNNHLVFLAELFYWFEVVKPTFVQPRVLDTEEPALTSLRNMPSVPISNVTKKSFMERPSSPEPPSLPLRPQPRNSGDMKRSTSMSFVDGCVGTWPKEQRSGPYGVSFDIPFDKEDTTQTSTPPGRGMTHSASTEGFKVHQMPRDMKRKLSFQPINGPGVGIEDEGCPDSLAGPDLPRQPGRPQPSGGLLRFPDGSSALDGHGNGAAIPSMEEALQIIHNTGRKPTQCPLAEGINRGFFLHSQNRGRGVVGLDPKAQPENMELDSLNTDNHVRTEDIGERLDEDSSLMEAASMELDMDTPSTCPSISSYGKSPSTSSGIKMTSFAEQKLRKLNIPESGRRSSSSGGGSSFKTTPEGSELGLPLSVSWAPTPEHSPVHQQSMPLTQAPPTGPSQAPPPSDPAQAMASEMVQLRMRLEEKRKAIETQKKMVEAAFMRHRQRMGRSAFLDVVKSRRGGDGERGNMTAEEERKTGRSKADMPSGVCWLKSPGGSMREEGGQGPSEVDLANYTRSMEKLNHSLGFLQMEMQRLAQQQEVIMAMREQQQQKAWVIPPPQTQPSPQKYARTSARSSDSPSPADSPRSTHRSPTSIKRKSASFHSRNTRTPRPSELKLAPYNRCLTAPQSVDSLPRLRRFSPCQPMAFTYMGDKPAGDTTETGDRDTEPVLSPEREAVSDSSPSSPAKYNQRTQQRTLEISKKDEDEVDEEDEEKEIEEQKDKMEEIQPIMVSTVSEVLAQPVKESFTVTPTETPLILDMFGQARSNLIEVPLYVLKPLEGEEMEESEDMQGTYGDDHNMACGFFFKGDGKEEDNMAERRAAHLEKRLRRNKDTQQKKLQQEAGLEQKKEESRVKAEEEHMRKEEGKVRRELIKQEYLRRKQLKLVEDMDTVIKHRPSGAKQRRARPKSIHRDSMESPRTPARAAGSQPRVFSVSNLSLASLNLGDSYTVHSEKRTPSVSLRSGSLCFLLSSPKRRRRRPDSADGFLSPCRSGSQNGEDNWENGSNTSSVKSNTEYTGPKLYKVPCAKSNKHIIQNALAHCCLAGKVNQGQKNKILEEMEKSEANNFLVLFRDGGCQFRSLYTYCPETDEATKLIGIGPKSITSKMIEGLHKYNSDRKQFSQIPAKTMSASVDAITIHGHLWQTRKPTTPKKVLPAKS